MTKVAFNCWWCGSEAFRERGQITRALSRGPIYCGKDCAGLARRLVNAPTEDEKRAAKAAYDAQYRRRNRAKLKAKKAAYFKATYDPEVAKVIRAKRMPWHVEYCRRPEYRAWKSSYDRQYNAKKSFGPFAEAALVLGDLQAEIDSRANRQDLNEAKGTFNKSINRRRDYARTNPQSVRR